MDEPDDAQLNLTTLAIFRAVVRENGVTRAAARLNRVQSNVTTRIKQLERDLGVELFTRESRRMVLTAAGQSLLPYAERLLELADEARQSLTEANPRGHLRIGAIESLAASGLPELLTLYRQRCPDVTIDLVFGTGETLLEQLRRFEVDAILIARPDDPAEIEPYACEVFGVDEVVLAAPCDHPRIAHPMDLRLDAMICLERGCTYRYIARKWFSDAGWQPDRIIEVRSYHALFAWIAAGVGYSFVPRSAIASMRDARSLSIHPLGETACIETILVWRDAHSPRAMNGLKSIVIDGAHKLGCAERSP